MPITTDGAGGANFSGSSLRKLSDLLLLADLRSESTAQRRGQKRTWTVASPTATATPCQ
jgi:hypothetical protein